MGSRVCAVRRHGCQHVHQQPLPGHCLRAPLAANTQRDQLPLLCMAGLLPGASAADQLLSTRCGLPHCCPSVANLGATALQVAKALQERHAGQARPPQAPPQQAAPKPAENTAATAPERQLQSQRPPLHRQQQQQQASQQETQQETVQKQSQQQQQAPQHNARPDNPNAMSVVMVGAECAPWSKTGGWVCSCDLASDIFDDNYQATLLVGCLCLPVLHSPSAFRLASNTCCYHTEARRCWCCAP